MIAFPTAPLPVAERDNIQTAEEFNLWCALNGKPFNLVQHDWPDGQVEWGIEVLPGSPRAGIVYGTGQGEESRAVVAAFGFVAGVDWAKLIPFEDPDSAQDSSKAAQADAATRSTQTDAGPGEGGEEAAPVEDTAAGRASCGPDGRKSAGGATPDDRKTVATTAWPDAHPRRRTNIYELPPIDLLQTPPPQDTLPAHDETMLARNARMLETVLRNFRIKGEIMDVRPGPVITLYELEPAPGTKSATVINLTDDIARSMSAITARIAIVPGRSVIGIELPNPVREMVYFREMLESDAYVDSPAKLGIVLGKDIGGDPVVTDLARMPHLLIAGTTGSGKSVAINTMILSLLYRHEPDRVRFILVDPKMLELSVYDNIPHLLTPVVTDPKKAVIALRWAVREMESRYEAMARLGVRNIEGYNNRIEELLAAGESLSRSMQVGVDGQTGEAIYETQELPPVKFPYIVIIVDEMADLMLVAGKEIEAAIQRLAQMARAAGIHLIMATQRPSVDVITGTIKANFPTRISFAVTSKIDSRTILGESGAEQLLGQGDMLFMAGGGRVTRIHGPFVSDSEVEDVVRFVRTQGTPKYVAVTDEDDYEEETSGNDDTPPSGTPSADDVYEQAIALVAREQKVSISFVQRHFQIGYNRSARLIERMETEKIISPASHTGKREVLVTLNQVLQRRAKGMDPGIGA